MSYKSGQDFEKELSERFHSRFPACLISSTLLRSRGCGQIDIAYFSKNRLVLVEAKSSKNIGPSAYQMKRLRSSQRFLSLILDIPVNLTISRK